mmetsp:Transcript_30890/g.64811  ORF Transcript_30890/g.64811 Transcript_30890/m.64811 type:complete len:235 (-) Transcript_30890:187-891(-)
MVRTRRGAQQLERRAVLPRDLHADRRVARDDERVVVRADEVQPALRRHRLGVRLRLAHRAAVPHDRRAAARDGGGAAVRRVHGHDDGRREAEAARGDAHRVAARADRHDDHPRAPLRLEVRQLGVRAADVEAVRGVEVLALQVDDGAQPVGEAAGVDERRRLDVVVHAARQREAKVVRRRVGLLERLAVAESAGRCGGRGEGFLRLKLGEGCADAVGKRAEGAVGRAGGGEAEE